MCFQLTWKATIVTTLLTNRARYLCLFQVPTRCFSSLVRSIKLKFLKCNAIAGKISHFFSLRKAFNLPLTMLQQQSEPRRKMFVESFYSQYSNLTTTVCIYIYLQIKCYFKQFFCMMFVCVCVFVCCFFQLAFMS